MDFLWGASIRLQLCWLTLHSIIEFKNNLISQKSQPVKEMQAGRALIIVKKRFTIICLANPNKWTFKNYELQRVAVYLSDDNCRCEFF